MSSEVPQASGVVVNQQIMPAPQQQLAPLANSELLAGISMELNREDISAVLISASSESIRGRISDLQNQVKSFEKSIRDTELVMTSYLEDWTGQQVNADTALKSFLDSVSSYIRRPVVPTFGTASYNDKTRLIHSSMSVNVPGKFTFEEEFRGDPSAEFLAARNTLRTLKSDLQVIQRDLLTARSALNNTDALRTNANAIMATAIAGRTEHGAKMIQDLKNNIDAQRLINSLT